VTFVDSTDSYVACLTCTKTATAGKYDCMHVKVTDPKGAKTLELKGWVDLPLASFPAMTTEGKSIFEQLTATAPDCEQSVNEAKTVTGTGCTGTSAQKWGISTADAATVGDDFFFIPLEFRQTQADTAEGAAWEAAFKTELSSFWSAFEQFDGTSTRKTERATDSNIIAGASAMGAVAAVVAFAALF
jgi:hypothetical protein